MIKYLTKSVATGIPRTFGSAFIAMALIPLIMRNVGADVYGAWTLLFIFVGLSSSLDIGIPKALIYLIPKEDVENEANRIFSASVVITLILMTLVVVIGTVLIFFRIPVWGNSAKISPSLSNLLLLSGVNIVCCGLISSLCQSLLEARYKIHFVNIIFFLRTALLYITVFLVSIQFTKIDHLVYTTNLIFILFVFIDISSIKILTRTELTFPRWSHVEVVFQRGKEFFMIGLATSIVRPLARYLVALLSVDIAANGVYDISVKIAMMAVGALSCFSVPLFSIFSGYGMEQTDKIKRVLIYITSLLATLFVLGVSTYWLLGKHILEFAFQEYDLRLFTTSWILLLGFGLFAVFEPYVRALWAMGHTKKCAAIRFCILVMFIVFVQTFAVVTEPLYRISLALATALSTGGVLFFSLFYSLYGFRMNNSKVLKQATNV